MTESGFSTLQKRARGEIILSRISVPFRHLYARQLWMLMRNIQNSAYMRSRQSAMWADALALLPDFILVLFLKCVQQTQCRSER